MARSSPARGVCERALFWGDVMRECLEDLRAADMGLERRWLGLKRGRA